MHWMPEHNNWNKIIPDIVPWGIKPLPIRTTAIEDSFSGPFESISFPPKDYYFLIFVSIDSFCLSLNFT